jgi:hypothetical protein
MRLYKKKSWDMATPDFQRLVRMDPENAAWMISTWISVDFGGHSKYSKTQGISRTYNNI